MITSPDNSRIKEVVKLRDKKKARDNSGLFIAEGLKIVQEAPEKAVRCVYCTGDVYEENPGLAERFENRLETVSSGVFAKMCDTETPQGILAVIKKRMLSADGIVNDEKQTPFILFLEDIRDPGNLGTIVRMSEAAGVTGVIMSKGTADIYNPKVVQATMGALARVSVEYTDLRTALEKLSTKMNVWGTFLEGKNIYTEEKLSQPAVLVMGNEGNGIRPEIERLISAKIFIPNYPTGRPTSESLNVATATAIACAEIRRRQTWQ